LLVLRSRLPSVHWPALPSARAALLLSLLHQFHHSQRLPPEALKARQFLQLAELLKHAFETTPFYRERLAAAGYRPGMAVDEALLARIPVLSRQDVQQAGPALHSARMPAGHGTPHSIESAGSTGTPVRVLATPLTQLLWEAFTLREHEWHQRDLGARRAASFGAGERACPPEPLRPPGKLGRFGDAAASRCQSRQPAMDHRALAPGRVPRRRCVGGARVVSEPRLSPPDSSDRGGCAAPSPRAGSPIVSGYAVTTGFDEFPYLNLLSFRRRAKTHTF